MSGVTTGDSDEAMRLAFEQYMMGGSRASTAATTIVNEAEEEERMAKEEEARKMKLQAEIRKAEKIYWHIFKRFINRVKDEWLDIDDQGYQVVKSIAGIRKRLPSEHKLLRQFRDVVVQKKDWACHGTRQVLIASKGEEEEEEEDYERGKGAAAPGLGLLSEEDVELALSHDLMQHEKMMSGLRSLFAQLSECHEALFRMLDEMTQHHLECSESFHWDDLPPSFRRASSLEGLMGDLLAMFSLELYRKQCMVHQVLDRVQDDLLRNTKKGGGGREDDSEWEDLTPQGVVDRCCRLWPKDCSESSIEIGTLENALNLFQG
eukprot:CAMPEP_0204627826 /NCGR_PEP_ID=MMETSP0717-20131115/14381_1 /ASSEMBLY_ACC=CAM_ASM_000666 /TAXON_ID=230516 /ORGANISM="Chaetoceros curvisetus" /LENGTH=318 /DNA_ID=CAMNT_0051644195 /DNA_START=332 /DNA_END=1288 /DNA_ORIENTATION=+